MPHPDTLPLESPLAAYLETLNPPQREAVMTLEGPLLILAGAGTGKTRVLITRIAHILLTQAAWPTEILAVTFTNKAASEMRERISELLGQPAEGFWLGTFHALCARMLRRHAELVHLTPNFTILDTDDQLRLLKQLMEAENIDPKANPPRLLLSLIERWKDRGLLPEQIKEGERHGTTGRLALRLYGLYQARLKVLNAVDFGDLILLSLTLLRENPDILAQYQQRFKYILVDEYQDTNIAQYLWLRLLSTGKNNICCVGDDDQSIYSWRGAEVGNILRFEQDFPNATIVRLEQNYRSTPHILGAASGLIAHNTGRLGKTLWTEQESGEKVKIVGLWDGEQEARWIGSQLEDMHREGIPLGDVAILVRAGFQTREFEECFLRLSIPYRVIGGLRFYERMEIRDALAYLRLAVSPRDDLAFERVLNTPKRGIGTTTLKLLHEVASLKNISLFEAARHLLRDETLRGKTRTSLTIFLDQIERWHSAVTLDGPTELVERILDESGYTGFWRQDKSIEAPGRLENLKELVVAVGEFENLPAFLEHVSLVTENLQQGQGLTPQDMVGIMTIHGAKGLEFHHVFLTGWEEGLFPHPKSLQDSGSEGLEEERRLAYVALTRARTTAHVSHVCRRRIHNQWTEVSPSRFIRELPAEHVQESRRPMPAPRQPHYGAIRYESHASGTPLINVTPTRARITQNKTVSDVGKKVFHEKFGYGVIEEIEGEVAQVRFHHAGLKKVMQSYLKTV